jgi:hypothetical protein
MKIWVDTESGTYGSDVDSLYKIDLNDFQVKLFEDMTDSDRAEFAKVWGVQVRMLGCVDDPLGRS